MMRTGSQVLYFDRYLTIEEELLKIAKLTVDDVNAAAEMLFRKESELSMVAVTPSKSEE
jgi:predicted Zn-dependent peptidase